MLFSSFSFLFVFFPLFMAVYLAVAPRWRYMVLAGFSLLFYAFGDAVSLGMLVFSVLWHYGVALIPNKRLSVLLAASVDVLLLGYFKYVVKAQPLGFSFYTFTALSYVIDVGRGEEAERNPVRALSYMTAFPKLLSGPITRYGAIRQEPYGKGVGFSKAREGIERFTAGFCKKTLLAAPALEMWNYLCELAPKGRGVMGSWLALAYYAFWLYYDFSGYTDMAIGIGKIMGVSLPENFRYPYTAESPKDFWRRWHISLSEWFRDYVYIPLGGSRCAPWRIYVNLLTVWVLTGLWHGSSLNFLLWGLYWFVLLALSRLLGGRLPAFPRPIKRALMVPVILISWLIFAFEDGGEGYEFFRSLFVGNAYSELVLYELSRGAVLLTVLAVGCGPWAKRWYEKNIRGYAWRRLSLVLGGFVMSLVYLVGGTQQTFLYFKF